MTMREFVGREVCWGERKRERKLLPPQLDPFTMVAGHLQLPVSKSQLPPLQFSHWITTFSSGLTQRYRGHKRKGGVEGQKHTKESIGDTPSLKKPKKTNQTSTTQTRIAIVIVQCWSVDTRTRKRHTRQSHGNSSKKRWNVEMRTRGHELHPAWLLPEHFSS